MIASLRPVGSLLLSVLLLLVGHGMQVTLLPLRAGALGWSEVQIGLTASSYFIGFVAGCVVAPKAVRRVGHIRAFAVMAAIATTVVLMIHLALFWQIWLVLRFMTGWVMAGLYTVIESWLNDRAGNEGRGAVLGVYTAVLLGGMTCGQLLINLGSPEIALPFLVAAVFLCLSIVPVGLTTALAPAPVEKATLHLGVLWRRSHVAVIGTVASGVILGTLWGLAPVFSAGAGLGVAGVTLFMSTVIVGGVALQFPVGRLSDRVDRRVMIIGICLAGALCAVGVAVWGSNSLLWLAAFLYGGAALSLYPVSLAHAADHSAKDEFVEIGSAMLLLNAMGSVVGPIVAAPMMSIVGAPALFWFDAAVFAAAGAYIVTRLPLRAPPAAEKEPFVMASEATPTVFDVDPRSESPART